ncbi:MAG: DUF4037 domain-containing protein [Chloroflexi bacterium]|nr:DUF4037 domain-containing protein [Chloroflexota bacterium]
MPGIELSRRYWHEVVAPMVDAVLPRTSRAAALLGQGSDVLGFDTARSTDHGWGPRVIVFVDDADLSEIRQRDLATAIHERLPETFGGFTTRFAVQAGAPVRHQVSFTTVGAWFTAALGFDPRGEVTDSDWLATPSQLVRTSVAGAVFEDGAGQLTEARHRLRWYPDDVWLYLLACQWRRIDQEEPFVGRTGEVGDEVGSAVVAARLVRDLMRLCFLIERQYAPYTKWLGTAFSRLQCAPALTPLFQSALCGSDWKQREAALVPATEEVARLFNNLCVTEPQEPTVRYFWSRPFLVLDSGRFVEACMAKTPLARLGYIGAIDQFLDSTDVLSYPPVARRLRNFIAGNYASTAPSP